MKGIAMPDSTLTYTEAEKQKIYLDVAKYFGTIVVIKLVLFYGIRKAAKYAANK